MNPVIYMPRTGAAEDTLSAKAVATSIRPSEDEKARKRGASQHGHIGVGEKRSASEASLEKSSLPAHKLK